MFTMGCILPYLLLPGGGTDTAVPLFTVEIKTKMLDIKRIDLFVHGRVLIFAFAPRFRCHDADTCVCKMLIYLRDMLQKNRQ